MRADTIRFQTGCDLLDMVTGGDKGVYGLPAGRFLNIVGDRSSGKASRLSSLVLTPTGWKKMADIHVGDYVSIPSGGKAKVIGEFPQGKRPCYRLTMSDGTYAECSDEHYWLVQSPNQAHSNTTFQEHNGVSLVTAKDILDLKERGNLNVSANRLYLPYNNPIEFNENAQLPIPPYLLGLLIADGGITSGTITLTIAEDDILDKIKTICNEIGYELYQHKNSNIEYNLKCSSGSHKAWLQNALRSLDLFGKKSTEKHIPELYLRASISDRQELLRGLFDGDGYVTKGANLNYSTSSKQLADDIADLIRGLGGYCSISKKTSPFYIKDGKRIYCNDSYNIYLRFGNDFKPFSSKKHEAKYVEHSKKSRFRGRKIINNIEYIGEEECKCIYIADPRHLYITDGYNVTHNTFLANEIITNAYYKYPKDKFKWIYDDCERGYSFDTQSMYGFDIIPYGEEISSSSVEEAYCNIANFADSLKDDQFGIYVLDSLDSLTSEEQNARAEDRLKAFNNDKSFDKGTYGMGKAKYLSSEFFPQLCSKIQDKNILVVIVSQIRENVDMFSFEKYSRSGGKALDFYAHMCIWLATAKKIVKKDRTTGVVVKAKVTKGKVPRPFRECFFTLLYDYGLDNTGSNIDYLFNLRTPQGELTSSAKAIRWEGGTEKLTLTTIKHWLEDYNYMDTYMNSKYYSGKITVDSVTEWAISKKEYLSKYQETFGTTMTRDELINYIEDNNLQEELRQRVEAKWEELEDEIKSSRRKKYGTQIE